MRSRSAIGVGVAIGIGIERDDARWHSAKRSSTYTHEVRRWSCAAIQDVLQVSEALSADDDNPQKALLDRLVAMLTKLGQRGYAIREEPGKHGAGQFDTDTD